MGPTDRNDGQYEFASPPSVPRERTPDILVKFQAVDRERPCLKSTSVFLSSRTNLLDVRKAIHRTFAPCYENGFIFLRQNREVLRGRERLLTLFDILPRVPSRVVNPVFKFPHVQYKRLSYDKGGRRYTSLCCGLVFLCADSGLSHWLEDALQMEISGSTLHGFDFIPWRICSATTHVEGVSVDIINELAASGDVKELSRHLDRVGLDVEGRLIKDSRLATPLHYAAQNGHLDVCELIINRLGREMLYMKNINRQTPLHCALTYAKFENSGFKRRMEKADGRLVSKLNVVCYLLQLSPDLQCQDVHGLSCYRMLFTMENKAVYKILEELDFGLLDDKLVLHFTCYALQYKRMEFARNLCAIVKVFDPNFYRPPLHLAAELGDADILKLLIHRSYDRSEENVEHTETSENTVQTKSEDGHHDIREKDPDGNLPFHYACQHGRVSLVPLLYYEQMTNEDLLKGVKLALTWGRKGILQAIIKLRELIILDDEIKGLIIHTIETVFSTEPDYARSLLPYLKSDRSELLRFPSQAARIGHLESIRWLSEEDVNLELQDVMGRTPLHEAAQTGQTEVVVFLLAAGVNPNTIDWRGSTPLHYACMAGRLDVARVLMKHEKCVTYVKDNTGRTPLLLTAYCRQRELLKVLVKDHLPLLDPHAVDVYNMSIFHFIHLLDVDTADVLLKNIQNGQNHDVSNVQTTGEKTESKRGRGKGLIASTMKCKNCGRVWTILGDRVRWYHKSRANSTDATAGVPVFCSNKNDVEVIHTVRGPFKSSYRDTDSVNYMKILIVNGRNDILEIVGRSNPAFLAETRLEVLLFAAYTWRVLSLKSLLSHVRASPDEMNLLMHVGCLQKPETDNDRKMQTELVEYLLNQNVSVNFIPKKNKGYQLLALTSDERNNLYLSPLELAVLHGNSSLVKSLVSHGASGSICFAVHIAILRGNVGLLEYLVKESTGDEIVSGTLELRRVCSLEMGILQALCNTTSLSVKLVSTLLKLYPQILKSNKLLTKNMVSDIRPDFDISCSTFVLKDVIFKNSLPLASLIKHLSKYREGEQMTLMLIRKGLYLDEVRVTKKGSVHVVCDAFMAAVKRQHWNICQELLKRGGNILWNCVLSKHHSCHKHVYILDMMDQSSFPITSIPLWRKFIKFAPFNLLASFFREGLGLTSLEHKVLKKKLNVLLKDSGFKDRFASENILLQIASHHATDNTKESIPGKIKLLMVFPKLFHVLPTLPLLCGRRSWGVLPMTYQTIGRGKAVDALKKSTLDRKMMYFLTRVASINIDGISLLHVLCLTEDYELTKIIIGSPDPLALNVDDKHGVTPLDYAAAVGDTKMMALLIDSGAAVTQTTLLAACTGPDIVRPLQSYDTRPTVASKHAQRLKVLVHLCSYLEIDVSFCHPYLGNILHIAVKDKHWQLVQYVMERGTNMNGSVLCERSTLNSLLSDGPTELCSSLFSKYKDHLVFASPESAQEAMLVAAMREDVEISMLLWKHLLEETEVLSIVSGRTKHGMTTLHYASRNGNFLLVKHVLAEIGKLGFDSICKVVNMEDKSKATPLWYALANGYWDLSEILLLYGAKLNLTRSVPGLWNKRHFEYTEIHDVPVRRQRKHAYESQLKRNVSTDVAECISPKSTTFKDVYRRRKDAAKYRASSPNYRPKNRQVDIKKRRLQYLLELSEYCRTRECSMIHAAAAVGDIELLKQMLKLTSGQSAAALESCPSPLVFSIVNHQFEAFDILLKMLNVSDCREDVCDALTFVIMEASGLQLQVQPREKKNVQCNIEETILKEFLASAKNKPNFTSFYRLKHYISKGTSSIDEDAISMVMKTLLQEDVPVLLLSALAYYGHLKPVQTLVACYSQKLDTIVTEKLLSRFSFVDLVFLFVKNRQNDLRNRTHILECLSNEAGLYPEEGLFAVVARRKLFPLMNVLLSNHTRTNRKLQNVENWVELFLESAKSGHLEFVQSMIENGEMMSYSDVDRVVSKALFLSCLHNNMSLVEYLLALKTSMKQHFENLNPRNRGSWVLDFAVLGGNLEIVRKLLELLDDRRDVDSFTIRDTMMIAAEYGSAAIMQLLMGARFVTSVLTKDLMEQLLLKTASRGHEKSSLLLLKNRYLDIRRTDNLGNSVLHYASMWNMTELAESVLKDSKDELRVVNSFGHNPLDLARLMGNVALSSMLATKYQAKPTKYVGMVTNGWLTHRLTKQTTTTPSSEDNLLRNSNLKGALTLATLLEWGDDDGALAMLETAQETAVEEMKTSNNDINLLHMCARYSCVESLKYTLALVKTHAPEELTNWLMGPEKPALAIAVENGHIECASILVKEDKCLEWSSELGENLLHVAARKGVVKVTEELAKDVPFDVFRSKDNSGLIPAATAVAHGNHHLLRYLMRGITHNEKEHSQHNDETDYSCILCLHEQSIGWSKMYQRGMIVELTPSRDIWNRHSTFFAGSVNMTYGMITIVGSKYPLHTVLATMGYDKDIVNAQMILINSSHDVLDKALRAGYESTACAYYTKHKGSVNNLEDLLLLAIQSGQNDFAKMVVESNSYDALVSDTLASPLETAIGFGNSVVAKDLEMRRVKEEFRTFQIISADYLPVSTQLRSSLSYPGDARWVTSVADPNTRMSLADVVLVLDRNSDLTTLIKANADYNNLIPKVFMDKELKVDYNSFASILHTWDELQIKALIMSKLVLGRLYEIIDATGSAWNSIVKISVECLPHDSNESSGVTTIGGTMRYKVKAMPSDTDGVLRVTTGEVTRELTAWPRSTRIIRDIAQSMEDMVKQELGLTVSIRIDWESLEAVKDSDLQSQLYDMLADESQGLGGLQGTLERCASLLADIESMCGETASLSTRNSLSNIREIVVRYSQVLPVIKSATFLPKDSSIIWTFSVKDDGLVYNSDYFPMRKYLHVCHLGYTVLSDTFRQLTYKCNGVHTSICYSWYMEYEQHFRKHDVKATIEWDSFDSCGMTTKVGSFMKSQVMPFLQRFCGEYHWLNVLHLGIEDITLRVTKKEKSAISMDKKTLIISLRVSHTGSEWTIDRFDHTKVIMALEENQIVSRYSETGFGEDLKSEESDIRDQLGLKISIEANELEWLKLVIKEDSREITPPATLFRGYFNKISSFYFSKFVVNILQSSLAIRYVGSFTLPAGGWVYLSPEEINDDKETDRVLLIGLSDNSERKSHLTTTARNEAVPRRKKRKPFGRYQIKSVSEVKELRSDDICGLWEYASFPTLLTSSAIKRLQLVSMNGNLFYVCDRSVLKRCLKRIPKTISVCQKKEESNKGITQQGQLKISLRDLNSSDGFYCEKQKYCNLSENLYTATKSKIDNVSVVYDVWCDAQKLGVHIVFELQDFDQESLGLAGYIMRTTLAEIANFPKRCDGNKHAVLSAVSEIGLIRIGFGNSFDNKDVIEKIEGRKYTEVADVSLLSEAVLLVNFKPALLDRDRELRPITDSLLAAVCCSFENQTPFMLSESLVHTFNANVDPENVQMFEFHNSTHKDRILNAAVQSRDNFHEALKAISEKQDEGERYQNAKAKLSMVTSLEFKDRRYRDGPVVGYSDGNVRYWVFKTDGELATKAEIEDDILNALDDSTSDDGYRGGSASGHQDMALLLSEDLFSDTSSILTVSCPRRRRRKMSRLDRLRRPSATSKLAKQKATERLFDHVEIGHTGNIENVLDVGADINARDDEGRTPLIRAAELRNHVLQGLLLANGADARKADKMGRTALHMEAGHGDVESIKLLMASGAKVNAKDKNGRTPLHYAVNKRQLDAVDILVFCGADVTIKDRLENSPVYQSRSAQMMQLLQESRQTVFGIKHKYVMIEHTRLEADESYHLTKLDLTIKTPPSIGTGCVNFIGRRVRPEYSRSSLVPSDKELLMSDVFEYRLSGTRPEGHVIMKIPVYDRPDLFEEVYMKTDGGVMSHLLRDIRYDEKMKQWYCYVRMMISSVNAFLLVTVPKVEKFPLSADGGVFTSSVDNMVEIKIHRDTFNTPGSLNLEVIPKPPIDEEVFRPVMSLSHFYDVKHSKGEQPKRDVEVTLPTPQDYFEEGDLYAMLRHQVSDLQDEEECWQVLTKNPDVRAGLVTITVPCFSDINLIEYKRPRVDEPVTEMDVIKTNAKLYEKAKRRECSVVFMAMLRPGEDDNCEAVVECTRNTRLQNRLHHWKMEGYTDQKPSYTSEFITCPKQEFNFGMGGNSMKVNNIVTKLQYHPKRENFLKFPICAKNIQEDQIGWVDIGEKARLEKAFIENPNYESLAKILVYLADVGRRAGTLPGDSLADKADPEEAKAFEGFTDKRLLHQLANMMGQEWMRIGLMFGFPKGSLESLRTQEHVEEVDKRLKVLTEWRDRRLHRCDHGVPELLITLQKTYRKDLVTFVIKQLEIWLEEKSERRDRFNTWLEKALRGSSGMTGGLLEPMSDEFLEALVQESGVVLGLAGDVDVSRPELEDIIADPLTPTDESKMVKLLMASRDKHDSRGQSLGTLVEGLTSHCLIQARNWALRTAREWSNNTELSDDPFVHAVNDYLEEAEVKYLNKQDNQTPD